MDAAYLLPAQLEASQGAGLLGGRGGKGSLERRTGKILPATGTVSASQCLSENNRWARCHFSIFCPDANARGAVRTPAPQAAFGAHDSESRCQRRGSELSKLRDLTFIYFPLPALYTPRVCCIAGFANRFKKTIIILL